jgi:alkaline phosphatase
MRRTLIIAACLAALAGPAQAAAVRNVILMIADGAGYNALAADRYWNGAALPFDGPEWRKGSLATYPLRTTEEPPAGFGPLEQDPNVVYDSARSWDPTPVAGTARGYDRAFAGYDWNRRTAPDSANTASALVNGTRSYDGAVNVDGAGRPLLTLPEAMKALGKSAGSISSVPFSHATPAAAGGAHSARREDYRRIAEEMFGAGVLDVIGGGGNPDYDATGRLREKPSYVWISEALWADLKRGAARADAGPWTLVEERSEIQAIAAGAAPPPARLAMLPRTGTTLQFDRPRGPGADRATYRPYDDPLTPGLPTLAEMTSAALAVLGQDEDGFYLHVESGAVDWAMHANVLGRMIEEYDAFAAAVRSVVAYIDDPATQASWDDTLVVVTADHDHLLFGPDGCRSGGVAFQPLQDNGAGALPGHCWASRNHSNQLVPLFARGAGSAELIALLRRSDAYAAPNGVRYGRGRYAHQAALGRFLLAAQAWPSRPGRRN